MSSYEIGIKNEYVKNGYKFICDIVAENSDAAFRRGAALGGIARNKIVCVQGECIAFNSMNRKGFSRWLLFEKPTVGR